MMKKKVWAIVSPEGNLVNISLRKEQAWYRFFENHLHKLPMERAIQAYEGIGYKRVEFELVKSVSIR